MTVHHQRFVLRGYIEHKNAANLRLHAWTAAIAWLSLLTALSNIRYAAETFVVVTLVYWLPVDALVVALVAALSALWRLTPFWGHHAIAAVAIILATRVVERFAHIYYHERSSFLRGLPSTAQVIHAGLFAPFHAWLQELLALGWRPALRARLDVLERDVLRSLSDVPWRNWAGTASCTAQRVSVPQTIDDLVLAVKAAHDRAQRVRLVASGFSWTSLSATSETLIFCERLDRIDVDVAARTVWAEAGVTNRQLNHALAHHGLCMPWNVVLETVRVAGLVTTGTHGTGKSTATVGDLVEALEVVDADGNLRTLSDETVGADVMSAVRLSLGVFGVIARVKLRVAPMQRVRQTDARLPSREVLDRLPELIASHDSVELYWFPFNRDVWMRTVDRTDAPATYRSHGFWFRAENLFQNAFLVLFSTVIDRFAPSLTRWLLRLGFRMLPFKTRVVDLPESHHYHHWIEMMPSGCMEVGFKADADGANVRRAWEVAERLVETYEKRGLYPLNLSLNVRFIGESAALLTPAYGTGTTCYIEIMWRGRPSGWVEFTSELCRAWCEVPGALPHWSKEFEHVDGIHQIVRAQLGDRRARFLDALERSGVDPQRRFWNPMVTRLLGSGT